MEFSDPCKPFRRGNVSLCLLEAPQRTGGASRSTPVVLIPVVSLRSADGPTPGTAIGQSGVVQSQEKVCNACGIYRDESGRKKQALRGSLATVQDKQPAGRRTAASLQQLGNSLLRRRFR